MAFLDARRWSTVCRAAAEEMHAALKLWLLRFRPGLLFLCFLSPGLGHMNLPRLWGCSRPPVPPSAGGNGGGAGDNLSRKLLRRILSSTTVLWWVLGIEKIRDQLLRKPRLD